MATGNIRRLTDTLQEELTRLKGDAAKVERAITALQGEQKKKPARATSRKRPTRQKKTEMLTRVTAILAEAEGPLTSGDVGKRMNVSASYAAGLLKTLRENGAAQVVGKSDGRGNAPLWAEADHGRDLLEDLQREPESRVHA